MNRRVFGVDIGGTTVKMGLFDVTGKILDKWEIPTRKENNGGFILSDIATSITNVIEKNEIERENIIGVGVGCPGMVDKRGTVFSAVNLKWDKVNIPEILGHMLGGIYVKAGNDANVAAYGEMWKGAGRGYKNLVAVTLGTGVGGGIIVDGKILRGAKGAGGEIGHIHVEDKETVPCACGSVGCLEQYASATGIVNIANRVLANTDRPSILRNVGKLTAKEIFDAVKENDAAAIEIAEIFGGYLGKGLSIIATVVNPEVFVIGGGVSKAGELLFQFTKPAMEKYLNNCNSGLELRLAALGNDAGIYGAAGLFLC